MTKPAWAAFCEKNQRGRLIKCEGRYWTVVTHLRDGVWMIERQTTKNRKGYERSKIILDWNGVPVIRLRR